VIAHVLASRAAYAYAGRPTDFAGRMTGADVVPERMSYRFGDPYATVHPGFHRNVRATRYEMMTARKRRVPGPLGPRPHVRPARDRRPPLRAGA